MHDSSINLFLKKKLNIRNKNIKIFINFYKKKKFFRN